MPRYLPWTWSQPHGRHYSYLVEDDGVTVLDTIWSGPANPGAPDTVTAVLGEQATEGAQPTAHPIPTAPIPQGSTTAHSSGSTIINSPESSRRQPTTQPSNSSPGLQYSSRRDGDDHDDDDNDGQGVLEDDNEDQFGSQNRGHQRFDSGNPNLNTSPVPLIIRSPVTSRPPTLATSSTYGYSPYQQQQASTYPSSLRMQQNSPHSTTAATASQPIATRPRIASLPADVQAEMGYLDRRFIQTGPDLNSTEQLDPRFRRVARNHHTFFFVPGRVFKLLWTEPAGQANPGRTRNSTHFSTVRFGEQAFSEIRRFVVVRNKGTFSQCIPIQTYKGQGATKPGIVMQDHGVIHTSVPAPMLLPGEYLNKYSIQVIPAAGEYLEPASRVNYGKAYAVEHNVKVMDIGMVMEGHKYLIQSYFDSAMRGQ